MIELESPRLSLRGWRDEDLPALAELSGDPHVMRHFPEPLTLAQSALLLARIREHFATHGFGLWALERKDSGELIGFTGLGHTGFSAHFTPAVEIGWRLARAHWGQGFAREAALTSLACAFEQLKLPEVVAFTALEENVRSQAVMRAIGMHHDPADDFDHPTLPEAHRLRRHLLYRLRREQWLERGHD